MDAANVGLCEAGVVAHHVEVLMAEDHLEGEDVASGAEVGDGEGVAEAMGMDA